jgi:ketopantoate reductase
MRVIVIGAGAIGGWLAATLARGGAEVGLVARGATLTYLEQTGLTLLEGDKRETLRLPAAERLQELPKADVVILAVKTYAFTDVVVQAAPALTSGTLFVTAMNGLPWWFLAGLQGPLENQSLESIDPGGKAEALLAGVRPAGAVVHVSARAESPGVIRIAAVDRLIVGEPGGKASRELSALGEIVNAGSARCDVVPDIRRERFNFRSCSAFQPWQIARVSWTSATRPSTPDSARSWGQSLRARSSSRSCWASPPWAIAQMRWTSATRPSTPDSARSWGQSLSSCLTDR